VEAGAHDGKLAADILGWLKIHRPELFAKIEYVILEPSPRRQTWQRETLRDFISQIRWFADWKDWSRFTRHSPANGIIFSNELLDAMPVRRFGWDAQAKEWFEWGVTVEGNGFVWTRCPDFFGPRSGEGFLRKDTGVAIVNRREGETTGSSPQPSPPLRRRGSGQRASADAAPFTRLVGAGNLPSSILNLPASLLQVLPDGYTIEACSAAENWWRAAANALSRGKLVAIDYGLTEDELFSPGRTRGTLRAYFRHHAADDLLANPGEQDLTAHVNFSAIQTAGEACGLATENFSTQSQFLTRILGMAVKAGFWDKLTSVQGRQFQTLTHPEHLGRTFRVLVQSR
jgi:SAM-dependent MidA family methyltransferase